MYEMENVSEDMPRPTAIDVLNNPSQKSSIEMAKIEVNFCRKF